MGVHNVKPIKGFLPPLQEIGFLVTVPNRHQILYIRDQNLLSRSYETVTERHNTRRSEKYWSRFSK